MPQFSPILHCVTFKQNCTPWSPIHIKAQEHFTHDGDFRDLKPILKRKKIIVVSLFILVHENVPSEPKILSATSYAWNLNPNRIITEFKKKLKGSIIASPLSRIFFSHLQGFFLAFFLFIIRLLFLFCFVWCVVYLYIIILYTFLYLVRAWKRYLQAHLQQESWSLQLEIRLPSRLVDGSLQRL